ncbi:AAA family ATPase [Anaerocolumna sp. AGMB13020]|uniref:AAA family ATPase n=1 Tax=Anaerocolumna sp. AGMB13020 TaxID=3081750 RepID=UPI002953053C|nr:AAA family ATPase [Anaerocolumna sp. AGMB13020]WOO36984.1 AAA family ATPase [Anaerocolumna sp. AGMB13020]
MKRKLFAQLKIWKESLQKKPLILTGAKGTGKTYLALTLAKDFYKRYIYINYELQADKDKLAACFERFLLTGVTSGLTPLEGSPEESDKGLFLVDDMNCIEEIDGIVMKISKLYPDWDILIISGYATYLQRDTYGINKYTTFKLYPMDFDEFLSAAGHEWYVEMIDESVIKKSSLPQIFHEALVNLFETYLIVGGLPAAVNEYINNENTENITQIHRDILYSYFYETDMKEENCALKVKQMLFTLPQQLSKRNKKFQFNQIRKGATENQYKESLTFIKSSFCGMICPRISDERISSYESEEISNNFSAFKLYLFDIGLYHSLSKITGCDLKEGFREGLIESYIAQVLTGADIPFGYWETASGNHSLFLLKAAYKNNYPVLPLEIRTKIQKRSKLLSTLKEKQPKINQMLVTTDEFSNEDVSGDIIPLYGVKNIIDNLILFR